MIAITGSIGTGKSTVCNIIKSMGFEVVDCDKIVHRLYEELSIISQIEKLFPSAVFNNKINRKELGRIIFNDKKSKQDLEELIHPYVRKELEKIQGKMVFVEVPLLFESKMEDIFNVVICVACDEKYQLQRVMERNNLDETSAMKIINSQMTMQSKIELSDYVIYNNENINNLIKDTKELINKIKNS